MSNKINHTVSMHQRQSKSLYNMIGWNFQASNMIGRNDKQLKKKRKKYVQLLLERHEALL